MKLMIIRVEVALAESVAAENKEKEGIKLL